LRRPERPKHELRLPSSPTLLPEGEGRRTIQFRTPLLPSGEGAGG
jgi:hypothetical protein